MPSDDNGRVLLPVRSLLPLFRNRNWIVAQAPFLCAEWLFARVSVAAASWQDLFRHHKRIQGRKVAERDAGKSVCEPLLHGLPACTLTSRVRAEWVTEPRCWASVYPSVGKPIIFLKRRLWRSHGLPCVPPGPAPSSVSHREGEARPSESSEPARLPRPMEAPHPLWAPALAAPCELAAPGEALPAALTCLRRPSHPRGLTSDAASASPVPSLTSVEWDRWSIPALLDALPFTAPPPLDTGFFGWQWCVRKHGGKNSFLFIKSISGGSFREKLSSFFNSPNLLQSDWATHSGPTHGYTSTRLPLLLQTHLESKQTAGGGWEASVPSLAGFSLVCELEQTASLCRPQSSHLWNM